MKAFIFLGFSALIATTTFAIDSTTPMTSIKQIPCYKTCDKKVCKECACNGVHWYDLSCISCYKDKKCVTCAEDHKKMLDNLSGNLKKKFCPQKKSFWSDWF